MKKLIANPNFIYIAAFMVPFLFYSLAWSMLYPQLRIPLFLFYLFTFLISSILGVVLHCCKPFTYTTIPVSKFNRLSIRTIYFLYFIEVLYSRKIPLVGLLTGTFEYSEDTFGLPVLHTFLVSFNTFYSIYLIHQYFSNKTRSTLYLFFWSLLPFILLVYRSSILSILLGAFLVYLFGMKRISGKMIFKSIAGVVIVLYLFGFMGNIRSGHGDPTYIPRSSGATEGFLESWVPSEFYWSYLYIASPVANLQNNIDNTDKPGGNFHQLVINECLPNFITKFVPFLQVPTVEFYQINPFLNVGTMYVYSFSYLKWKGIVFFFLYFILFINLYYLIVIKSKTFKVTGLAILFTVIIFGNFHNTIAYSASSIQLLYPVLFSAIKGLSVSRGQSQKINLNAAS